MALSHLAAIDPGVVVYLNRLSDFLFEAARVANLRAGRGRDALAAAQGDVTWPPRRRVALVTGAGTRVGRAIALDLARHGWEVVAHFHSHRPPRSLLGIRGDLRLPGRPRVAGPARSASASPGSTCS